MGPKNCQVCEEAPSKYKCSTCLIPYCSLGCFKKHKPQSSWHPSSFRVICCTEALLACACAEVPCHKAESSKEEEVDIAADPSSTRNVNKRYNVDGQSEVLQKSQLQSIASSNEIRGLVKNQDLHKLIYNIACSADPENELDKAMNEESFRLFTDKILSTIAPDARVFLGDHDFLTISRCCQARQKSDAFFYFFLFVL